MSLRNVSAPTLGPLPPRAGQRFECASGKKYGVRVLAINVSSINEEEAGALNGHDVPVKNDYGAEDVSHGRRIDTLLARTRRQGWFSDSFTEIAKPRLSSRFPFRERALPARVRENSYRSGMVDPSN